MKVFKDTEGRAWNIEIHATALKKCKALTGQDLVKLLDGEWEKVGQFLADIITFVDVLYALCQDQAEKRGVSDEQFGRAMSGDVLQQAVDAFLEELIDFFPDPRRRAALKKVIQASKEVGEKVMDHSQAILAKIDIEALTKQVIEQASAKGSSVGSGNAPASLESTPDRLPIAS